ncbi:hypothetical protein ASD28_22785 [Massilia sp. Root133]|nr:hypothetical protein ASD28_22785 [Massilia sp. Root133]
MDLMGTWIRGGILTMLTFGAFWGGAIFTWRGTDRAPTTSDLVTYLFALPLAVLAGVLLVRRLARTEPASASAAAAAAPATPVPVAAARLPALALVDAAVRLRHGDSIDELAATIAAQRARPDPDPELVDDAGYPVMTVRVPSAADAAWRAGAEPWLAAQGHPDARFGEAHWRALALASSVVDELAGAALDAADGTLLRIAPLAPADWTAAQRTAAGAWLAHVAAQAGWDADKVTVSPAPPGEPAAAASALLSVLAGQAVTEPVLTLLLAFDSRIDQARVDRMAAEGTLFTAAHPQGLVPGEGAAGLLLAHAAHAAPTLQAASTTRGASADATPRADATDLRRLAERLLAETAVDASAVSALFADADHRSNRVLEAMALAHDDLPHLDAGIDVRTTGPACGQSGAVAFLAALALARHQAVEAAGAVLCVANNDPIHRSVALVRPAGAAAAATVG